MELTGYVLCLVASQQPIQDWAVDYNTMRKQKTLPLLQKGAWTMVYSTEGHLDSTDARSDCAPSPSSDLSMATGAGKAAEGTERGKKGQGMGGTWGGEAVGEGGSGTHSCPQRGSMGMLISPMPTCLYTNPTFALSMTRKILNMRRVGDRLCECSKCMACLHIHAAPPLQAYRKAWGITIQ